MPTPAPVKPASDPWQEAAAQFKSSQAQGGSAPTQAPADEDWKLWTQGTAAAQPTSTLEKIGQGAKEVGSRAFQTFASPVLHPIDTITGMVKQIGTSPYDERNPINQRVREFVTEPNRAKAWEDVGGDVLGMAAQGAAVKILPKISEGAVGARQFLRPSSSPDIVPEPELAARKLAKNVIPPGRDVQQFINAAPLEVPNILEHARSTGNPLNTQLEFSKAAEANAKSARDFYENQILHPNDKLVKTTGSGYGQQTGEGPDTYARLSDIDKRVGQINRELSSSYAKGNPGDVRESLAGKTALQNEAAALTNILHSSLSDATGIPPEDIANLRQRVGRSYELANDTNAAVTSRAQGVGKAEQGPLHLGQFLSKGLDLIRGTPEDVANRSFRKQIWNFPGESQPLPTINPPAAAPAPALRSPVWASAGIEPGQTPIEPINPDVQGARDLWTGRRNSRLVDQAVVQTEKNDRAAAAEAQKARNRAKHGNY